MSKILVTGAAGFIGRAVCQLVRKIGMDCVAIDKQASAPISDEEDELARHAVLACDLTDSVSLDALFGSRTFDIVIHLAAVLPGAASRDPVPATNVNVGGSMALFQRATAHGVRRFVFGSSTSVYGSAGTNAPISEQASAAPTDVYGAAKRAVEIVGENLRKNSRIEFVALRIATVIGPGARNTSSPWRSEIFEKLDNKQSVMLPYDPGDLLTVVHVNDVACMLVTLAQAKSIQHTIYNTPAELLTAAQLKQAVESAAPETHIELSGRTRPLAPLADGSRFTREFGFEIKPLQRALGAALLRCSNQI
ncbi:MAG TPA: NAD(P)-dependent oxidoreductase [Terriglobales bacterium]|nr:NAD(P)-dependent oxidoreductase [Terriglobales bacterium]